MIFPASSPDASQRRRREGEWRLVLAAVLIAAVVIAVAVLVR